MSASQIVEKPSRKFRYDKRMFNDRSFQEMVKGSWNEQDKDKSLHQRLQDCRRSVSTWKRDHTFNSAVHIVHLKEELDFVMSFENRNTAEIRQIRDELCQAYKDEEEYWKLKKRNEWLKAGDRNTKFFYATTKTRRARNRILAVEDESGMVQRGDVVIGHTSKNYFQQLFTTSREANFNYDEVFDEFPKRITEAMNEDLILPITEKEVRKAVFSIGPDKTP